MLSKPSTIKDIAKKLGISISTVSRALHDHQTIGLITRQKVKRMAQELNYEPNLTAIFLRKGRTFSIGVILPELSEVFFSSAISAIENTAYKRNYIVILAQSHDNELLEKQLVEKMKNFRVDGLLVSVGKNTSTFQHFDNLKQFNIPVVYFDCIPAIPNIHYVACNMETGTIEAVSYLLNKGHSTIGLINGPVALRASGERTEGYVKAMTKNRLKIDQSQIVSCDLTEKGTQNAMDDLFANKRKATAIITFNDYIALFAIEYARKLNIETSIEFVSYANVPFISLMTNVPTASVEQFPFLQGQKAADILFDLLNNKDGGFMEQSAYYNTIIESKLIENKNNCRNSI